MAALRFYHKPTCSKSRETKKLLDEVGAEYDTVLYIDEPPSLKELKQIAAALDGFTVRDMIRPKEAKAEGWDPETNGSDDAILAFLAKHPVALQRPIVVKGDRAVLGRPVEAVRGLL